MCGKNHHSARVIHIIPGSPPRVREKPSYHAWTKSKLRITPACAGKTLWNCSLTCFTQDHPRVCGKNHLKRVLNHSRLGSPPRVREKHGSNRSRKNTRGITPACAGKTKPLFLTWRLTRDHPRVCGKNATFPRFVTGRTGSPPRVREKLFNIQEQVRIFGITPACAGKTACLLKWSNPILGSPPRVREKLRGDLLNGVYCRITPACAGKTLHYSIMAEIQ